MSAVISPYFTLAEAARYLRCSPRHFKRHVLPFLVPIENGRILLFTAQELDAWADRAKAGICESRDLPPNPTTPSASRTRRGKPLSSPQAQAILAKLRA